MKKLPIVSIIALAVLFSLAGCSTPVTAPTLTPEGTATPAPTFTQTTVLSANGTVAKTTFTDAAAGSYVVLAFTNDSGADRSGWGIGGVGNSWGDQEILSITPASFPIGATMTQELAVSSIVAGSTTTDVYFNIYNGCTLNSVILFVPN